VAFLCRVLKVSRSAYYAWMASRSARRLRQRAEAELVAGIRVLHAASRGAYGAQRIRTALRRAGQMVNEKRVERLMREHRIIGVTRRRRRCLTRQPRLAVFAKRSGSKYPKALFPTMRVVGNKAFGAPRAAQRLLTSPAALSSDSRAEGRSAARRVTCRVGVGYLSQLRQR
jgi:hypothetical protein